VNAAAPVPAFSRTDPGWRLRLESLPFERLRGLGIATALVATSGAVLARNLSAAPVVGPAEGTVLSRAWAADALGRLNPGAHLYDRPPLGWLQLAAWTRLTSAFERAPTALTAGREAMVVAYVVAAGLLWVLARRLGLARWSSVVALVLFGFSPLAVALHRQASIENVAVPWLLAAFVLAATPRRRLAAFAASGAALGVAVLSAGPALFVAPALGLALWRSAGPASRRYALLVAGALFAAVCGAFLAYATLRGQLVGGDGPTFAGGLRDALVELTPTGSVFSGGTVGNDIVGSWLGLDALGPLLALAAAPVALLALPRLAPIAVAYLVLVAAVVRPGHLSATLATVLLPFGALLVAGVAERLLTGGPAAVPDAADAAAAATPATGRRAGRTAAVTGPDAAVARIKGPGALPALAGRRGARSRVAGAGAGTRTALGSPARLGVAVALAALAVALWAGDGRALLTDDPNAVGRDAGAWMAANVPDGTHLLVDGALWAELATSGAPPADLTVHPAFDDPPAAADEALDDWPGTGVIVSTPTTRDAALTDPRLQATLDGSLTVAAFGAGDAEVEVRAVDASAADIESLRDHDPIRAREAGGSLARNPDVQLTPSARHDLVEGRVDERVMTTLVALAAQAPVAVDAFPAHEAEAAAGEARRSVTLRPAEDGRDGAGADAIESLVTNQDPPYRPADVTVGSGGWVTVTWAVSALT
jgi:hypothetical protein